jgi:beta-lactamase class A
MTSTHRHRRITKVASASLSPMTNLAIMTRRGLLAATATGLLSSATGCSRGPSNPGGPTGQQAATASQQAVKASLAGLERRYGARLGAYALETSTRAAVGYRADERFPMCSTYKVLAAAAVLHQGKSAALAERLAEEAVSNSDNTAGNLLLGKLGGPAGLTAYARSLGDLVTRLDRTEPTLNEARPGDPRDTTTPRAIAADYKAILLGTVLNLSDRALVAKWMKGSTTGADRIRAAVPSDWMVGDKSGTGGYGTDNDVAILWPPQRPPIILAVMSTRSSQSAAPDNALVATTARTVLGALGVLT